MSKIIDKETVYELEHKAINKGGNSWECNNDEERARLLSYFEGIHDMALWLLEYLEE